MSGYDDDRKCRSQSGKLPQQVEATHAGHPHVGDDAPRFGLPQSFQEAHRRIINADLEMRGSEQKRQRFAQRFVIIDDVNHRLIGHQPLPRWRPREA